MAIDLPTSTDSERHLLAGMIFNEDAAGDVLRILGEQGAEYFTETPNKAIWSVIAALIAKGDKVTLANITRNLHTDYRADVLGLTEISHTIADPLPYANVVRDFYQRRQIVELCQRVTAEAQMVDATTILRTIEDAVQAIGKGVNLEEPATVGEVIPEVVEEFQRLANPDIPNRNGIMTGIPILDQKLCGLRTGLIILAAQPKVGKTTMAVNIPCNAAKVGVPSLIFSLEMSKEELVQRIFSIEAGVDMHNLRTGFNARAELAKAEEHATRLKDYPIHINDTAGLTVSDIRAISRRHVAKYGPGLILIDYMQLIQSKSRYDQRHIELADTANALKNLSKELDCPVVVLSQLSAEAEQCENGYEMIKKLAGAKAILAALDVGIVLHIPKGSNLSDSMGAIVVTIAASRSTPTGSEEMVFDKKHQRFLAKTHEQPPPQSYRSPYETHGTYYDEFVENEL